MKYLTLASVVWLLAVAPLHGQSASSQFIPLPVSAAKGGTGVGTLTGIVKGNGASAMTGMTTSSGLAGALSDETGSGALVFGTSPTLSAAVITAAVNTTPLAISGYSLTGANTQPAISVTGAWSTSASPSFIFANVTGTSGLAANLIELQSNGTETFKVSKTGLTSSNDFRAVNHIYIYDQDAGDTYFLGETGGIHLYAQDNTDGRFYCGVLVASGYVYGNVYVFPAVAATYGTTVNINAASASVFLITATNATAFTIANPTNPLSDQIIKIRVKNTTGGALGAATWGSAYKLATWTQPATATSRCIEFKYDGTNWIECSRTPADVPN